MNRSFFGPTVQFGPGDIGEPYPEDDEDVEYDPFEMARSADEVAADREMDERSSR